MIANAAKTSEKYYSLEEWLEIEETADEKSEFHDGEIIPIEAATYRHSVISSNFQGALQQVLRKKKKNCRVSDGSVKVYFPEYNHGGYPGISVVCGKPEFWQNDQRIIVNTIMVAEVLSPSTEDYDRGGKFARYRSLPSFREYVLIFQDEPKIETWYKLEENVWRISRFEGLEAVMKLDSLDCEISLGDIFYQIEAEE